MRRIAASASPSVFCAPFEEGFKWWNLGYASAVAFVLFAIMLAGTVLQPAVARRWSRS